MFTHPGTKKKKSNSIFQHRIDTLKETIINIINSIIFLKPYQNNNHISSQGAKNLRNAKNGFNRDDTAILLNSFNLMVFSTWTDNSSNHISISCFTEFNFDMTNACQLGINNIHANWYVVFHIKRDKSFILNESKILFISSRVILSSVSSLLGVLTDRMISVCFSGIRIIIIPISTRSTTWSFPLNFFTLCVPNKTHLFDKDLLD